MMSQHHTSERVSPALEMAVQEHHLPAIKILEAGIWATVALGDRTADERPPAASVNRRSSTTINWRFADQLKEAADILRVSNAAGAPGRRDLLARGLKHADAYEAACKQSGFGRWKMSPAERLQIITAAATGLTCMSPLLWDQAHARLLDWSRLCADGCNTIAIWSRNAQALSCLWRDRDRALRGLETLGPTVPATPDTWSADYIAPSTTADAKHALRIAKRRAQTQARKRQRRRKPAKAACRPPEKAVQTPPS